MHPEQHTELDNLITMQHNLGNSAKGSNDAYDVHTSLTGYEPNDIGLQRARQLPGFLLLHCTVIGPGHRRRYARQAAHRSTPRTCRLPQSGRVCQSVSRHCLSCSIEQGNLWEKEMSISQLVLVSRETRTVLTASFSENTQAEKVVDRTGKFVGENSSNAQIRTLLDEQRQIIIAEYCEKIGHHELQAARAEEERRILQEQLWRQQKDFRQVHQQSLTEMEELRKFQSSTFDTLARRKLIEDQNTIMELSRRLQELQNEVNCMNDSKDFQDAESVRSGNSHVTSQPMLFPYTSDT